MNKNYYLICGIILLLISFLPFLYKLLRTILIIVGIALVLYGLYLLLGNNKKEEKNTVNVNEIDETNLHTPTTVVNNEGKEKVSEIQRGRRVIKRYVKQ